VVLPLLFADVADPTEGTLEVFHNNINNAFLSLWCEEHKILTLGRVVISVFAGYEESVGSGGGEFCDYLYMFH
jgi:hypothetical protein